MKLAQWPLCWPSLSGPVPTALQPLPASSSEPGHHRSSVTFLLLLTSRPLCVLFALQDPVPLYVLCFLLSQTVRGKGHLLEEAFSASHSG